MAAAGLLPFFSNNPGVEAAQNTMKDAFQEVLKLYGVPGELAEAIAKNAQAAQGRSQIKVHEFSEMFWIISFIHSSL